MSADNAVGIDHVVVEVQHPDQQAVDQHGIGNAVLFVSADDRADGISADLADSFDHRVCDMIVQAGDAACERVEQQHFRLLDRRLRHIAAAESERPVRKLLDGARTLKAFIVFGHVSNVTFKTRAVWGGNGPFYWAGGGSVKTRALPPWPCQNC